MACGFFAAAALVAVALATVALVVGVVVLTVGESVQVAGAWELSHGHAPAADRGMYLAVFSMGTGLQRSVGPGLLLVFETLGTATWLPLAAAFVLAGRAMSRWGATTITRTTSTGQSGSQEGAEARSTLAPNPAATPPGGGGRDQ